jgi:acyl carrier protein
MTKEEIFNRVVEDCVDQLAVKAEDVKMESKFVEDLEADSLDFVELVQVFEEEFEIAVPDDQMGNIKTIGDAVSLIEKLMHQEKVS